MAPVPGKLFSLLASVVLLTAVSVSAQTGGIQLTVHDSSGSGMQALGKADNLASGVSRAFRTDSSGVFALAGLPYGRYRLEVAAAGFTTQTAVVEVKSATPVVQVVSLAIGAANYQLNVVGVTPLAGVELPLDQIPAPVQTLTVKDFESAGALDLSDLINRRLGSVNVNETQGNPVQPDVNFRGYTASPLLGTPEGLSIYMDGVRMNQPFGDVVSWDLIPRMAIAEVALIPGSNPLFGLNTLGGALSLQTKSGASKPGTSIGVSGGSFGRRAVEFDHGWANSKGLNWYVAGNLFHDDGWRQASPSDVRQAFSKLGWQGAKTNISLTGSYANNELTGNGLQEFRALQRDYTSPYTLYDRTNNRAPFLNLSLRHTPNTSLTLSGNVYFRYIRADTYNGDINEGSLDQSVYQPGAAEQAALRAAGYTGFPTAGANAANTPFPFWRCIGNVLLQDEPGEKCNGVINRTYTKQHNYGLSGQATWLSERGGKRNQLTVGAAHDRSNVDFLQTAELGYILPDLNVKGLGVFADGVNAGEVDGEPFDNRANLRGTIHTSSLFGTDTLQAGHGLTLTFSGRYNSTVLDNFDRIRPTAGTGSLTGHHNFRRLNPSAGFTYSPNSTIGIYGSYAEGSRAPTSIELGCADPASPCKLPNSLAGDPPLQQVVTRTIEAGVRSGPERRTTWNAGWFFAQNSNDILFVSSTATSLGYFKNFGKTRRQGLEGGVRVRVGRFTVGSNYTFLDATFQSSETVGGSGNSANDLALKGFRGQEGVQKIQAGNRIPLIPQHIVKAFVDYQATSKFTLDLDFRAVSSAFARGNENNLSKPDGTYYIGQGTSPGYGVVNLGARYQVVKHLQAYIQVNNLLDRKYYTGAQLGATGFTAAGNFIARPFPVASNGAYPIVQTTFFAPAAPLGVTGGIRLTF